MERASLNSLGESPSLSSHSYEDQNLLTCISCGYPVNELYCLPCLHPVAVCSLPECLNKLRTNRIHCPDCEETFCLTPESLDYQPLASRIAAERLAHRLIHSLSCEEEHADIRTATSYCRQCSCALCGECGQEHLKRIASKDHNVLPLDSLGDVTSSGCASLYLCKEHQERATLFCLKCDRLVCHRCSSAVGRHKHHRAKPIDREVEEDQKAILQAHLPSVETLASRLKNSSRKICQTKETLHQRKDATKVRVHQMADELIAQIVTRRDELCDKVDEIAAVKGQQLDLSHLEQAAMLRKLVQFQKLASQLLSEEAFPHEQLALKRTFVERVKELNRMGYTLPCDPPAAASIEMTFRESLSQLLSGIQSLGYISGGPDPHQCVVRLDGALELQGAVRVNLNDPIWFIVKAVDVNGKPCTQGGENLLAYLGPRNSSGAMLQGYVEDLEDGIYRLSFSGAPATDCHLKVSLGRELLSQMPLPFRFLDYSCKREISLNEYGYDKPTVLALSRDGCLLAVTDEKSKLVCLLNPSTGKLIGTVGNGQGSAQGQFKEWLRGLAFDSQGNLAVSDSDNHRVQIFDRQGHFIGTRGECLLEDPRGLVFNEKDDLFVIDGRSVFVFDKKGELCNRFDGEMQKGQVQRENIQQVVLGPDGLLYITDKGGCCVSVFQQGGHHVRSFGSYGRQRGHLDRPCGIFVTNDNHVLVTSHHKVSVFTTKGTFVTEFGNHELLPRDVKLHAPFGILADFRGYIFVADRNNKKIRVY